MFFGNNLQDTRLFFYDSWQKYQLGQPLLPLEQQLVDVISGHPEYHPLLADKSRQDLIPFPEGQTNPFLHMGLHLAIRDQISTNRPDGITGLFQQLITKHQDQNHIEHKMMECLEACLWQAGRTGQAPDEAAYLAALAGL